MASTAIENMPSELNESLTNVRQLDLQAQSNFKKDIIFNFQDILDSLSETIQTFFENCRFGKLLEYEKSTQILNITRVTCGMLLRISTGIWASTCSLQGQTRNSGKYV